MHPLVEDYLNKEAAESLKRKNELLIDLGLFEKEYSDKNKISDEFPLFDGDAHKYYKKIPIKVSDEEYAEILKYHKKGTRTENKISEIFKTLSWAIFICGLFTGIVLGKSSFAIILIYWVAFFVAGMMYYGLAEIIQLLTDIKNK